MTLALRPDIAEGLKELASAQGLSVEDCLHKLLARELSAPTLPFSPSSEGGMVMENGWLVYKAGEPLPAHFLNDAIRRLRDERSQHILGNRP